VNRGRKAVTPIDFECRRFCEKFAQKNLQMQPIQICMEVKNTGEDLKKFAPLQKMHRYKISAKTTVKCRAIKPGRIHH